MALAFGVIQVWVTLVLEGHCAKNVCQVLSSTSKQANKCLQDTIARKLHAGVFVECWI